MPGLQAKIPEHWEHTFSALALEEGALSKSLKKKKEEYA